MNPDTIRAEISLTAAMATFLAALFIWVYVDPEAAGIFIDGGAPDWARTAWWSAGAVVLAIMWSTGRLGGNIIGTIFCVVLGPVTLLTFIYQWASLKLWPPKSSSS